MFLWHFLQCSICIDVSNEIDLRETYSPRVSWCSSCMMSAKCFDPIYRQQMHDSHTLSYTVCFSPSCGFKLPIRCVIYGITLVYLCVLAPRVTKEACAVSYEGLKRGDEIFRHPTDWLGARGHGIAGPVAVVPRSGCTMYCNTVASVDHVGEGKREGESVDINTLEVNPVSPVC